MAENHRGVMQKTTAWEKVGLIGENQEVETDFSGLSGEALELCWSSFLKISFYFYQIIYPYCPPRLTTKNSSSQTTPSPQFSYLFLEGTTFNLTVVYFGI